ncbi:MAG: M1 family metallopeptidase [Flavobacteriales bacterium]|jgi:aminopeptidase N
MTKGMFLLFLTIGFGFAQKPYTHQDTLRGSIGPERSWWDVQQYSLSFKLDPKTRSLQGTNRIRYKVVAPGKTMQIDLQPPMQLVSITQEGKSLVVKRDGNAHFVTLEEEQPLGSTKEIEVSYRGRPSEASNPPWDGGFTWDTDKQGKAFISTSCQEIGASLWWPCKDHMYDEPDQGMDISVEIPKGLMAVSNGRLVEQKKMETTTRYHWRVVNPINSYGVNISIGDYVKATDTYAGLNGDLTLEFWVLRENESKINWLRKDVVRMLKAFEHWFGPYPFYEDGYKIVETPFLGMEHQSAIAYGNAFGNGYLGTDMSGTGWGNKFDYIVIHESGHEWFANNITAKDNADLWIHESFTTYSEGLFVEYFYGKNAGYAYLKGLQEDIRNRAPLIGAYGVNDPNNPEIYAKGANVIHTLRQVVNDDTKWLEILRGLNRTFYHQTVMTQQIESYLSDRAGLDLSAFFNQYLRDPRKPTLELKNEGKGMYARWTHCLPSFDMPVRLIVGGKELTAHPTQDWVWVSDSFSLENIRVVDGYYINVQRNK